jgi:chromosome segregation ATPase
VKYTADDDDRKRVKRVRKVTASRSGEPQERGDDPGEFDGDEADMYRYVTVPPVGDDGGPVRSSSPMAEQVRELFDEFQGDVADDEESFRQFMLWAAADDNVVFEDLLIATKSVYDIMDEPMPCSKETWSELVEIANMVEVTKVSDSEVEYALEVFSKAYDLYKAELRRLDDVRDEAERASSERISDEIMAEDNGLFTAPEEEEEPLEETTDEEYRAHLERWDKLVDDTRYQINSTKAEFDELMEELAHPKEERELALSRLRILEKDAKRRKARLERYQRGRISDAKAEEIAHLERELVAIEDEMADWNSRLSISQERIDQNIGLCAQKRGEFLHIKDEVNSLLGSLNAHDRVVVTEALAGEMEDLDDILEDVDDWLSQLTSDGTDTEGDTASIIDSPPPVGEAARERVDTISQEVVEKPLPAEGEVPDEPPVVFMDAEVRRMLSELPMERPPEEELLLRIDSLQQELMNRENTILQLEHTIEELMEDKQGSTTAVELERNKYKLELNKIQEELVEKQGLLEQYLQVIRDLETKMEAKDKELDETMRLNRQKTAELRQKESALEAMERELVEGQEEFRQEKQELMDRETRLNAQVSERETLEREMAKKDLTLELRNEQIRKKMDRLTARELELQRVTSKNKEMEEMLTLKERELQNLKTELDVREEEMRRRETSTEERTEELKKLQSEVTKLEHRVRSRDESLRRREAHQEEEEIKIQNQEAFIAEREVQLRDREEELNLREAKVESTVANLDSQRDRIEGERRQVSTQRQETERLRIALDQRHEDMMRREDSVSVREDALRERERAVQLREERLELEKEELTRSRSEADELELKWSAREKNLLERLDAFNTEKEELMEEWKVAKERVRELEREKAELTAKVIAAESSLMNKDTEILEIARELDSAQGREEDAVVELDEGVKTSLQRIMEDVERQQVALHDLEERSAKVDEREKRLVELEEILSKEREKVRELLAEQEKGRTDLQEAMEELTRRTESTDELETSVKDREAQLVLREEEMAAREESVRQREREMDRLTTAELAEARAEDREEELAKLQRDLEDRTRDLEDREENLERQLHDIRDEEVELERQKSELLLARESMLKASVGEEVPPAPAILTASPPSEVASSHGRSGLARRAALMVAQSRREGEEGEPKVPSEVEAPATEEGEREETEDAEGTDEERRPLARLKCKACSTIIPIYTEERPLEIVCPDCGKKGILK